MTKTLVILEEFHKRPLHCQLGIPFQIEKMLCDAGISDMEQLIDIGAHWYSFSPEEKQRI